MPLARHILFVTALHVEAQVILKRLPMKPQQLAGNLRCWQSNEASLVITGTGKIRSAIGTTAMLRHLLSQQPKAPIVAINFGLCGAINPEAAEIGETILIHRIRDSGSGRNWFPDILINHNFKEGALETHDAVVKDPADARLAFVDMEASGFFEAAAALLGPSHVHTLKVVSDHLSCTRLDRKRIVNDLDSSAPAIIEWSLRAAQLLPTREDILAPDQQEAINAAIAGLRLSETRGHQLQKAAKSWHIRTNGHPNDEIGDPSRFNDFSKNQRLAEFKRLLERFNEA